ncbi:ThiF family adenylyltransferase [Herbiconiux daphne]|uniref:ThiF family adenylyltransferase n=1 Tax=Herbiconiux daphne TaxID=2970914 RepID=A0ABT2H6G2_9MICO|nr:ThiF family adenylyltransferase [Herbiconiux daphne]MCS5735541.1 ThiF family adenylyltransferase [Herbiconiux daphne]
MKTVDSPEFSRNYGFWSEAEQQALIGARVAIAGVGGVGFQVGTKLARMGVASFAIADPEDFEPQNANRVPGATTATYGRSKADVFREQVRAINPAAVVNVFHDGVTVENVGEFLEGASLVFDESETTHPEIGTTIARHARELGIPDVLVVNVGFAAHVTAFAPHSRWTFERFMGLSDTAPLDEIAAATVDYSRFLPYIPPYSDLRGLVSMTTDAPDGSSVSLPSISPGVDLASAIGTTQGFLHLTAGVSNRRTRPIWAPRVAYLDAYSLRGRVTRAGRFTHLRHLAVAALRFKLGRNPAASYTHDDIARRAGG